MDPIEYVRAELADRKGEWIHIATASEVSYRALRNLMLKPEHDPRTSTVKALADWLKKHPRERIAA